ncbi:MAG: hypothetical protein JOY94_22355 [Methylobacteriaceae bacterium]|nr:hypothetical protein [Methylobacteriaceae bacterium]
MTKAVRAAVEIDQKYRNFLIHGGHRQIAFSRRSEREGTARQTYSARAAFSIGGRLDSGLGFTRPRNQPRRAGETSSAHERHAGEVPQIINQLPQGINSCAAKPAMMHLLR